ncbi:MAG: HD domain-containing protein [Candidatus Kaiserbacteria bacterium]|nr:HD domain-containing protein [Candidatus Kaiserbacteria bacterium]MCB9815960.1 HD domain-containing protein [Candidatus Nomurabacteria bacterium]
MLPHIWELIESHTDKRSVMRAVAQVWDKGSAEYADIQEAYCDAFRGHRDQTRDSGERYFRHVLGVVIIILCWLKIHDADLIIAAFLHDLVEDKPHLWTLRKIEAKYGKRVANLVRAVTKPEYSRYGGKTERHAVATANKVRMGGRIAIILKLADRLHNMLTLWGTPRKKQSKIRETTIYYLPMAHQVKLLWRELHLAIAEQIKSDHMYDNEDSEVGHDLLA